MIGKVILLPFWIVKNTLSLVFGIAKLVVGTITGAAGFLFRHVLGTVFGALVGLLLGSKHIGIRIFPGKKKKKIARKVGLKKS